jgi:hypothetical protein
MIGIEGKSVSELRELNIRRMVRVHDIPEYNAWGLMKQRCNNPNYPKYRDWGGRGITVCAEWKKDFWAWFEYIGRRPVDGLTQERGDNNRGYEPGNVRWDTYKTQNANQRSPILPGGKTSRYQGVSWAAKSNKWRATIRINGVELRLGYFSNQTDAAIAWNYHCAHYGLAKPLNVIEAAD